MSMVYSRLNSVASMRRPVRRDDYLVHDAITAILRVHVMFIVDFGDP